MIRTTVVGSWPPDEQFTDSMEPFHRGRLSAKEAEPLLTEVARVAIEQQRACGLDEITGGETAADTFILQFPRYLSGIEPTEDHQAWGGRGTYRLVGTLDAPHGLGIATAYRRERAIDPTIGKVTIPGPSEITTMIDSLGADADAQRLALWDRAIALIRREIQECVDAGATDIQLDLPQVAMGLADDLPLWRNLRAVDVVQRVFENFDGVRRSVHFCYGDFNAQSWTENRAFEPLLATIQALDGWVDRLVLEFSLPEQWAERELLRQIPQSMEVAAGIVDVKSPRIQSPSEIAKKIETLSRIIPEDRLLICPSCGFGRRDTTLAIAKSQAMTAAVARVNGTGEPG